MSARPPTPFSENHPNVTRLFADYLKAEEAYWRKSGIFPIMHVVAIKRALLAQYPWVAMNLYKAFDEAKNRSLARALDATASHLPIPWGFSYAAAARELFGQDFWPYGIEANRPTLDAFLQYAYEQGVSQRRLTIEELFATEVQSRFRI